MGMDFDTIIIGAGAAGLFCASLAGKMGKTVAVIDHAKKIGKKILISGGGRCNFTNINAADANCYLSENPHFVKSALARYTPFHFIELVKAYNIPFHEKTLGQLFCDNSAREIVSMLENECKTAGVQILLEQSVVNITKEDNFKVVTQERTLKSTSLVIATGGPSIPKMGASDFAYKIARQFNLPVTNHRPALVPLVLPESEKLFTSLSGIATPMAASAGGQTFQEAGLFTHKGLSGPAILQASSYWRENEEIKINFISNQQEGWLLSLKQSQPRWHLKRALNQLFPERLSTAFDAKFNLKSMLGDSKDAALNDIEYRLRNWVFHPIQSEGYAKAEVTLGGVSTNALSSKTLSVKQIPQLYFIGECVDVTGWLGGYNFQWAWSSAYAAAQNIAIQ